MFLFTYLGIEALKSVVNVSEMLEALEKLPLGLRNVYGLRLDRLAIEASVRRNLARRIFLWVCRGVRPLTLARTVIRSLLESRNGKFWSGESPFQDDILGLCCPLSSIEVKPILFTLPMFLLLNFSATLSNSSQISPQATYFLFDYKSSYFKLSGVTLGYIRREEISNTIEVNNKLFPLAMYTTNN